MPLVSSCVFYCKVCILFTSEFLVSELQAAGMIKYQELHPEVVTEGEEPAKEQRVPDHSSENAAICQEHDEDGDASDRNTRQTEMQAEWKLLLEALDTDASSQFADVEREVRLMHEKV